MYGVWYVHVTANLQQYVYPYSRRYRYIHIRYIYTWPEKNQKMGALVLGEQRQRKQRTKSEEEDVANTEMKKKKKRTLYFAPYAGLPATTQINMYNTLPLHSSQKVDDGIQFISFEKAELMLGQPKISQGIC